MSYYNHRVRLLASLSKSFTTWRFCNMSCQSYLEQHCWWLRLSIQWHLQQPTPSAHSHSRQSSCEAVSVCLCAESKQKELGGEKKSVSVWEKAKETQGRGNKLSRRWQLSWQIKPCLQISADCVKRGILVLFFFITICAYFWESRIKMRAMKHQKSECSVMFTCQLPSTW